MFNVWKHTESGNTVVRKYLGIMGIYMNTSGGKQHILHGAGWSRSHCWLAAVCLRAHVRPMVKAAGKLSTVRVIRRFCL